VTVTWAAALAGLGILVVVGAPAATGLQATLGLPGTLLAIIAMVVFGDPTAGQSIATPLLASPRTAHNGLIWTPPSHRPRWYRRAGGRSCSSRPSRRRISEPKPIMRPEAFEWSRVIAAAPSGHIVSYRTRRAVPCPAGRETLA
jgi:hypothetical protein